MHWKQREKLQTANRLYLTFFDEDDLLTCYELRIQLPNSQYVYINLLNEAPPTFEYHSLSPNGFGLGDAENNGTINYNRKQTLKILQSLRNKENINQSTIDTLIDLINGMNPYI